MSQASVKERIRHMIDQLPDDCSLEDVLYHLYVVEKIHRRLQLIDDQGELLADEEVRKRMERWLSA